jgi:hypothetical protein
MKTADALKAAGMEIVAYKRGRRTWYVLRDDLTGLYRSARAMESMFAWCWAAACAARFATRAACGRVAEAYARGEDTAAELAAECPSPKDHYYPPTDGRAQGKRAMV